MASASQWLRAMRELDRKFAWSFIGVVLGVVFGGVTIYAQFFADLNPHLRYEILANAPVLDVHEDISKLSVLFDGIDIRKQKESLRVMTIRVLNDSSADILKGYYDENDPLGLTISSGKIIRADLQDASNLYLEKQLVPLQLSETTLSFPDVILEQQEFFLIKLLILHPEDVLPEIRPIGKIAGIREVPVTEVYRREPAPSFLRRAFGGGVLVQIVRWLAYSVLTVVLLLLLLAVAIELPDSVATWRYRRSTERALNEFKEYAKGANVEVIPQDETILCDVLGKRGQLGGVILEYSRNEKEMEFLPFLLSILSDPKELESNYLLAKKEEKDREEAEATKERAKKEAHERLEAERAKRSPADIAAETFRWLIPYCVERGLVLETEKGPAVNKHMRDTLQALAEFLQKTGFLEKD